MDRARYALVHTLGGMRILVVGAGATGSFYGGLLFHAGRDVTFLLRGTRAAQVHANGLQIILHTGEELTLHPPVLSAEDLAASKPAFDLVLLTVKSYQLAGALEDIAPVVRPETMLLPILNGMCQLDVLAQRFSPAQVLGGSVRVMALMDAQHRMVQMNALEEMNYGELSGQRTERILAVDAAMQGCGFTATLQPDILATLWQKWILLASLGAFCSLVGGTVGQGAAVPYGQQVALGLVDECTAIATANGYPPPPTLLTEHTARMTSPDSHISSSMYRDMTHGAPVEADHILGDLLARAGQVHAPLLQAAYVRLKVYEAGRRNAPAQHPAPSGTA